MFGVQLAVLFSVRGIVTLVCLLAISLLIWFGGTHLVVSEQRPLDQMTVRAAAIVSIFFVVVLVTLVRYWLARRTNRRIIKSLMESEGVIGHADNSREEVELIRKRFEDALKVLRDTVFAGKRGPSYLFELPWYIIIGPPGAGKSAILRNSGLEFSLSRQLGVEPVAGIGGTRNCDWWFAEDAVLIDTASRYTTQDKDTEVDRAAWRGFVDLLLTHRRRRPINGILVAVSLADLLSPDEPVRRRYTEAIRSRIQELLKTFRMRIPVYLLVNKCDMLPGFTEYFGDLDQQGRAQVWGKTFPLGPCDRIGDAVSLAMQELAERLEARLPLRMHDERDLIRRGLMFAFPKEFWGIRSAIAGFVSEVFRSRRFEVEPMLRGVYFTSGTQEGEPIDRVIDAIGRNFGLQLTRRMPTVGLGRGFFIKQLLTDVIFAEQGLVGRNLKLERRLALVHGGGHIMAMVLTVAAFIVWYSAFTRNEARIDQTRVAAQIAEARLLETRGPLDLKAVLPTLNAARRLRLVAGEDSWFAWLDGLGISATPVLAPAAHNAYDRILLNRLLPVFAGRLAIRIDALLRGGNDALLDQVKQVFRTYWMLSDPGHFDRGEVEHAAHNEVARTFALDPTSAGELNQHFARLIQLLPKPISVDQQFVGAVRSRLSKRPVVEQVYARLLREGAQNTRLRPIDLIGLVGSDQLEITQMRALQIAFPAIDEQEPVDNAAMIPGIFTREGFLNFVLPNLPLIARAEQNDDWLLAGAPIDTADIQQIALKVMDRYVNDYIRVWSNALGSIHVVKFDDLQRGSAIMRGLAGSQSTLQQVVSLVRDNSNLLPPGEQTLAKAGDIGTTAGPSSAAVGHAAGALFRAAFGDAPWPGTRITEAFRPLAQLTTDGASGQSTGMDHIRGLFGDLYAAMANIVAAPDPNQAAFQLVQRRAQDPNNDAFGALRADSALRAEPIRTIMNETALQTWSILLKRARDHVDAVWTREVIPVCQGIIFQRYPVFELASEDMSLKDFGDFFRPGGIVDDFSQKYISPLVVDRRTGLAPATIDGAEVPIRADALSQFRRARDIRNAFFSSPGSAPAVRFSIKPVYLSPKLMGATFVLDGKELAYRHEAPRAYEFEWPTRTDASIASITLTAADKTEERVERAGPWALFRLLDASQLASGGASDRFAMTIGKPDGTNVTYELRAASVSNPFSLSVLRSFRCPDSL
ncbi:type VI secretion system membrane subunit TssM [Bradyrhizobium sp. Ai1a-2]|uniref:type VI secretion system membrane subunit TssM n=1 Tax=Bradyrhizobium sp. Ai1a-2 TaxID=196490 RepID=UPI000427E33F|nr:type VI secretion system membrane subunit TssM [Bradyrhizobium sp. Ai1a-2]